jgi:hypothetical protein
VTVSAAGTTTTTTTTSPITTQTSTGSPPPSSPEPQSTGSLLARAFAISHLERGHVVRGSLDLAPGAKGATLQLELLASLGGTSLVVGHLTRDSVPAGQISFAVALDARARSVLRRRGHLALKLRVRVAAPGVTPLSLTRALTLRA